jgi:hypothetical protein
LGVKFSSWAELLKDKQNRKPNKIILEQQLEKITHPPDYHQLLKANICILDVEPDKYQACNSYT